VLNKLRNFAEYILIVDKLTALLETRKHKHIFWRIKGCSRKQQQGEERKKRIKEKKRKKERKKECGPRVENCTNVVL
jgi:hypothetical protein